MVLVLKYPSASSLQVYFPASFCRTCAINKVPLAALSRGSIAGIVTLSLTQVKLLMPVNELKSLLVHRKRRGSPLLTDNVLEL